MFGILRGFFIFIWHFAWVFYFYFVSSSQHTLIFKPPYHSQLAATVKSKEWPGSVTQSFCTNALPQPGFNMHKSEQQLIPTNTVSYLVCKVNAHSSNTNTAGPGLITDRSFKLPDSNRHILPGVQGEHPQHQHQCLVSHYCMMVDSSRQILPGVQGEHAQH